MEKEQVAVDETTETVAEQNARSYSKTVWDESTPITVDRLNKIENGIASALPLTGGTLTGKIDVPGESTFYKDTYVDPWENTACVIKASGNVGIGGSLKVNENLSFSKVGGGGLNACIANLTLEANTGNGQMLNVGIGNTIHVGNPNTPLYIESSSNPIVHVGGGAYHLYHTGNFNPATKLDAGNFSISNRDLLIYGKRALVGFNAADGNFLSINHERDFAAGVRIHGLTVIESIENGGKLTFYNQIGGGQMSSLINCQELQNNTGNGQMMTAFSNRIYVGNPNTHLTIESGSNPIVNVGGREYQLYHTGNKPTAWDIGAMSSNAPTFQGNMIQAGPGGRDWIYHINADLGTLNIAPHNNGNNDWSKQILFDRNGAIFCNGGKKVATWDGNNPSHYMFRYGSGLGGANGYITFSY